MKLIKYFKGRHYIIDLFDDTDFDDEYGVERYRVSWITNISDAKKYKPRVKQEGEYHDKEFDNFDDAQRFYWQMSDELLFEEDPDLRVDEEAAQQLLDAIFGKK